MKTLFQLIFILMPGIVLAQTQTIKGTIRDQQSSEPLVGVAIIIEEITPAKGTVTDVNGDFILSEVPYGRWTLIIQYLGYKPQVIPNVLVTAGKEVVLSPTLEESVQKLDEIVITANSGSQSINELAKVSGRTFDTEQVLRFSGGRNDVARLATTFAGVSAPNDSRNDIVVRGNSPVGLLWRIEGIPVANPNHFSTQGTTGGPVSALNTNLLRTSDFITGAFPAEYGNANSAVFDVNFRNGNRDKHEFTAQLSAFSGLEFMAEGPFNKKNGGSFIASYRYGIASLAATGTSSTPFYQDLSFKVNTGEMSWGQLELFGMGGLSSIDFLGDDIDENDLFANPNENAYVKSEIGLIGLRHTLRLPGAAYLVTSVGGSTNFNKFTQDNIIRDEEGNQTSLYRATNVDNRENRLTANIQYNKKFNARWNMRAGVMNETYFADYWVEDRDGRADIPDDDGDGIPDYFVPIIDVDEAYHIPQLYAQGEFNISDNLSLTAGLHTQYHSITEDFVAEPRAGASWQFKPGQRLNLAYGLHSQSIPSPILFYEEEVSPGQFERTNAGLGFMRSHHIVTGYDRMIGKNWHVRAEAYYQYLFNAPVEKISSSYSVINEGADFEFDERGSLVNEGTGSNIGIELTVERYFNDDYYLMVTGSLFDSRYKGSDGIERNTAFNNQYVINALFGKEWKFGAQKQNAFTFDTKVTSSGGQPYSPIDLESTRMNGGRIEVTFDEQAYSERLKPYFRWDVKFGVRLNAKKRSLSHQFFVDLQNVTNRENEFVRRYNDVTDDINTVSQIGFFPDIMYRLQF